MRIGELEWSLYEMKVNRQFFLSIQYENLKAQGKGKKLYELRSRFVFIIETVAPKILISSR